MVPIATETFGVHLMMDCYGADPEALANPEALRGMMLEIVRRLGMHQIHEPVVVEVGPKNRKDPGGLSGFLLIAESHISFHTFPKRQFATIDVYTCQNDVDADVVAHVLSGTLRYQNIERFTQRRGIRYPSENLVE